MIPIPQGFTSLTTYLTVKNTVTAIDFYVTAFGAKEIGRITMPDGSIGHAELLIGNSKIFLADENLSWGNKSAETLGGSPAGIVLYVPHVDEVFAKALHGGSTAVDLVKDQFHGNRSGSLIDPFGFKWMIMTHLEDLSYEEIQKRCDELFAG